MDALLYRDAGIRVLKNGNQFYPAELEAISKARRSIALEAFEFLPGEIAREFIDKLAERARSGVDVRLVIDRMGSWRTPKSFFDPLTNAGGRVVFYHPLTLRDLPYIDHRTHRKLVVIDEDTGFIGGAGFADHWMKQTSHNAPWRDTVLQVQGPAVGSLKSAFGENWVSTTGEISLSGPGGSKAAGDKTCMIVVSNPGYGATRARILFQTLIDSAKTDVRITTPYFLPDHSARHAIRRAVRDRGVRVRLITKGSNSDHASVRRLSEVMSAKLIRAGMEYYEYRPHMVHAKLMTIDGLWSVAGSTNFDHRSFSLNGEVNIAVCDREVAHTLEEQFEQDLSESRRISAAQARRLTASTEALAEADWMLRKEE